MSATHLSPRFTEAIDYARRMHDGAVRKGTGIPYLSHPLAVASMVLEAGGDEDQAIAALLHDVAEDCGGEARLAEIEAMFGPRVALTVRGCSDSLTPDPKAKAPWRERKEEHLRQMQAANPDVVMVSTADKLHNSRSILGDVTRNGIAALDRFNAPPPDIAWYYTSMLALLTQRGAPADLRDELADVVGRLVEVISSARL